MNTYMIHSIVTGKLAGFFLADSPEDALDLLQVSIGKIDNPRLWMINQIK